MQHHLASELKKTCNYRYCSRVLSFLIAVIFFWLQIASLQVASFLLSIVVLIPFMSSIFTARCTIVQSAVLRLHVVCLSVSDVGGSGSHRLEILETNCTVNYPNTFALRRSKAIYLLPGEHGEILRRLKKYNWQIFSQFKYLHPLQLGVVS